MLSLVFMSGNKDIQSNIKLVISFESSHMYACVCIRKTINDNHACKFMCAHRSV